MPQTPRAKRIYAYKRPQLGFGGVTAVGLDNYRTDGVNNWSQILFPDGDWREESNTTRRTFVITRNAVLTNSGAQSGLRTSLSEATNTWYAIYAVKISDSTSGFVTVGDTTLPTLTTYATLNSTYGVNNWVYLGMIRNGDNSGATGDIVNFVQSGNKTIFINSGSGIGGSLPGTRLAFNASTTSLVYTTTNGVGATDIPEHLGLITWQFRVTLGTDGNVSGQNTSNGSRFLQFHRNTDNSGLYGNWVSSSSAGATLSLSPSNGQAEIWVGGFVDNALGVGANPFI